MAKNLKLPPEFKLTLDPQAEPSLESVCHFYSEKSSFWVKEVRQSGVKVDLNINLETFKQNQNFLQTGLNHGDFVPWHMIYKDGLIYLIDGEHASKYKLEYYDIAYFFHRLYTGAKNPKLAKKFLKEVFFCIPEIDKQNFKIAFESILGLRIIGGFWDYRAESDLSFHFGLQKEFRERLLLN